MNRKRLIILILIVTLLAFIFIPEYSKLRQLEEENAFLDDQIRTLRETNISLKEEIYKLENDPVYVESVAREKLKKTRKGEVIYRTK